ncbi:hypothetical protein AVEN_41651-1 [Araneus ventricosus]|uniref:Uncharacterized protein n=1 Tax=Araneus ventricosus TaxID=182803 RepID=A0A4Y2V2S7_ARAVE|nr:hypothetical protein AVEN_41651-1 [Araneus ventricosus]
MALKVSCNKCGSAARTSPFLVFQCGCTYHEACLKTMIGEHCPVHLPVRPADDHHDPTPTPGDMNRSGSASLCSFVEVVYRTVVFIAAIIGVFQFLMGMVEDAGGDVKGGGPPPRPEIQ